MSILLFAELTWIQLLGLLLSNYYSFFFLLLTILAAICCCLVGESLVQYVSCLYYCIYADNFWLKLDAKASGSAYATIVRVSSTFSITAISQVILAVYVLHTACSVVVVVISLMLMHYQGI